MSTHTDSAAAPGVQAPLEEYGEGYFQSYNYADRPLGKFSMYWFARRFYARLARRFAPKTSVTGRALEMGSGLGHLTGLLSEHFTSVGFDIAHFAAMQTQVNAPHSAALVASADQLDAFTDESFDVVVALHLVEHLVEPEKSVREVYRMLAPDGLFLFATPHPEYSLRHLKEQPDAIAKDPTHINVQTPQMWRTWCEAAGFMVIRQFGDGLWDVPYLPIIPSVVQFALFGIPSVVQVVIARAIIPISLGVNTITLARKPAT